jgi:hypothetical protein
MAKSTKIIIAEMLEFIKREGGHPKSWRVGVTNDPRRQLFDRHQVHYQNDAWIYRTAQSEGEALHAQMYFLECGLKEDKGWQPGACAVYAYRESIRTETLIKASPRSGRVRAMSMTRRLRHISIIPVTETNSTPEN